MSKLEQTLPSGACLVFETPPFSEALALLEVVLDELKYLEISFNVKNIEEAVQNPVLLSNEEFDGLKRTAFHLLTSQAVVRAVETCGRRALYNNSRLIFETVFEEEQARQDYFFVLYYLGKHSLRPFLQGLTFA
jgi:hypothetical protein